ncbi:UNVERIFIED_CONTAM: putative mitochondrial protein [Sesamum calycinum]|uniref:Mitochondrial protein n=1 Tax=Sesamum calycinum TaxID=2727403 RepID=A0AAW2NY42_9LAMI
MCRAITSDLTIRRENKMELYLGLPSSVTRTKHALFATIRDHIWQKISSWNETLFRKPEKRGKRKIHWIAWNRLCDSKLTGGLGFRQLHLFNLAMLAKQLWRIMMFPERLLNKVLKARYFPNGDIFTATPTDLVSAYYSSSCGIDCEEDVLHTMVLCSFARQVWGCAPFHLAAVRIDSMGFREWLTAVSVQFDEIDFQLLLGLCWSIWWCINGLAMNGSCLDPPQVVCFVSQYLSSFRTQNSDDQRQVTPTVPSSWLAPPPGYVKINFDGATFNNGRVLGVGVAARGSSGECLAWISKRFQRMGDGEVAKAMAAREAILLAKRNPSVIFEGDCATLIDKILAPVVDLSAIGPIVADIR